MIIQSPPIADGIQNINRYLRSSSPYDRHVRTRLCVVKLIALTAIGNLIHSGVAIYDTITAAVKLISGNHRQAKSKLVLSLKAGFTAVAGTAAVISGPFMVLVPHSTQHVYKTLSLYQLPSKWGVLATRITIATSCILPWAALLINCMLSSSVRTISVFSRPKFFLVVGLISIVFTAIYARGTLPFLPRSSKPTHSEKLLRERIESNSATKQLLCDAEKICGLPIQIKLKNAHEMGHSMGGHCIPGHGEISIQESANATEALRIAIFELCNMCDKQKMFKLSRDADLGKFSRNDYGRESELAEYSSALMYANIVRQAKATDSSFPLDENHYHFDSEESLLLTQEQAGHTENCRKRWDRDYMISYQCRQLPIYLWARLNKCLTLRNEAN